MSKSPKSPELLSLQTAYMQKRWGIVYRSTERLLNLRPVVAPAEVIAQIPEQPKVELKAINNTVVAGTAINAAQLGMQQEQDAKDGNVAEKLKEVYDIHDQAA